MEFPSSLRAKETIASFTAPNFWLWSSENLTSFYDQLGWEGASRSIASDEQTFSLQSLTLLEEMSRTYFLGESTIFTYTTIHHWKLFRLVKAQDSEGLALDCKLLGERTQQGRAFAQTL